MDTALNERFKKIRSLLKLSQVEMGEQIDLKQGSITDIERNRIGVTNKVAQRLFDVLNVNQVWFYTGKEEPFTNVKNGNDLNIVELSKQGKYLKKNLEEYLKDNYKELVELYYVCEDIEFQALKLEDIIPEISIEDISHPSDYSKWKNGLPSNHPLIIGQNAYNQNIVSHLQSLAEYQEIIIEFYSKVKELIKKTKPLVTD